MPYITTYTGKHFDPTAPDKSLMDIRDIAHSLSLICRGNGHVNRFFSVAEHCIYCAKEAYLRGYGERVALACLIHDGAEAYMSDVPRPFKRTLAGYIEAEEHMLDLIYEKFLGSLPTDEEAKLIKQIDDDLLYFDLRELLDEAPEGEEPQIMVDLNYDVIPFEQAENEYLELFEWLTAQLEEA